MSDSNVIKSSIPKGIFKQSLMVKLITLNSEVKNLAESSKLCLLTEFASRARTCPI